MVWKILFVTETYVSLALIHITFSGITAFLVSQSIRCDLLTNTLKVDKNQQSQIQQNVLRIKEAN